MAALLISNFCSAQAFDNKNSNMTESNFSNFNTGRDYCLNARENKVYVNTCMPIFNKNGDGYINVAILGNDHIGVAPFTIFGAFDQVHSSTSFYTSVTNTVTGQTIYTGLITNMVGLICDSNSCTPWK
ncbi:hypothetical protein [Parashewanella curva]|uniref:hypothetical protein n=1 Tax=Parashewanella curva TaxID=2338552 RepID=UPI00105955AD|nr:hypothetical protein [Parashewanella curva]